MHGCLLSTMSLFVQMVAGSKNELFREVIISNETLNLSLVPNFLYILIRYDKYELFREGVLAGNMSDFLQ